MKINQIVLVSLLLTVPTTIFAVDTVSTVEAGSKFIIEKNDASGTDLLTVEHNTGAVVITGDVDMKWNKIINVADGTSDTSVATKGYADNSILEAGGFATQITEQYEWNELRNTAGDDCSKREPKGTWRLPTPNELMTLCASGAGNDCNDKELHLTTKRADSNENSGGSNGWVAIRPFTHEWVSGNIYQYLFYRCVK
jgi:hypothetical protein